VWDKEAVAWFFQWLSDCMRAMAYLEVAADAARAAELKQEMRDRLITNGRGT
jgi:hypothetical protein